MSDATSASRFLELELRVEVWLADEELPLERLLELHPGDTLVLARDPDAPVELVVNGAIVATGELVVVEGKFGFRVTSTSQPKLAALGDETAAAAAEPAEARP